MRKFHLPCILWCIRTEHTKILCFISPFCLSVPFWSILMHLNKFKNSCLDSFHPSFEHSLRQKCKIHSLCYFAHLKDAALCVYPHFSKSVPKSSPDFNSINHKHCWQSTGEKNVFQSLFFKAFVQWTEKSDNHKICFGSCPNPAKGEKRNLTVPQTVIQLWN